jgi:hypothetical protein
VLVLRFGVARVGVLVTDLLLFSFATDLRLLIFGGGEELRW